MTIIEQAQQILDESKNTTKSIAELAKEKGLKPTAVYNAVQRIKARAGAIATRQQVAPRAKQVQVSRAQKEVGDTNHDLGRYQGGAADEALEDDYVTEPVVSKYSAPVKFSLNSRERLQDALRIVKDTAHSGRLIGETAFNLGLAAGHLQKAIELTA